MIFKIILKNKFLILICNSSSLHEPFSESLSKFLPTFSFYILDTEKEPFGNVTLHIWWFVFKITSIAISILLRFQWILYLRVALHLVGKVRALDRLRILVNWQAWGQLPAQSPDFIGHFLEISSLVWGLLFLLTKSNLLNSYSTAE